MERLATTPVQLFGPLHLALLMATGVIALALCFSVRHGSISSRTTRLVLGYGLIVNELIWFAFRYSHEGFRPALNLPLQLCDATLWATAFACITLIPALVEFSYFAGVAGAGMALITPDLWSPWPSYPAIYFFLVHSGIVVAVLLLVFGGIAPLRKGAVWRAFAMVVAYAVVIGTLNAILGSNYMYLRKKPTNASILDMFGPWPMYLVAGAALALALFWLLWLPARYITKTAVRPLA